MMIDPLERAIIQARCSKEDIDCVVLAGGSSRIKKVKELLVEYFGKGEGILKCCDNPDESVSKGACVLAGILQGDDPDLDKFEFTDVNSHGYGIAIQLEDGINRDDDETCEVYHEMIPKNT